MIIAKMESNRNTSVFRYFSFPGIIKPKKRPHRALDGDAFLLQINHETSITASFSKSAPLEAISFL